MAVFCLVHGSAQSSAGWKLLVSELERRDEEALTVNLPINEPDASATRYDDVIAATLRDRGAPDDVIVVTHSVSGIFLPLVPGRHPAGHLVFLAARSRRSA
jgi:hypothetical protein